MEDSKISCALYGEAALGQAYRILGLGNRDPQSPAYGCFDRYYWHYRQVDFVNARFQEAGQFLALLYRYPHAQNRFYQAARVREWAMAAVHYWTRIQRGDGSFDEYWPYERSFCVTSFTLYAAAETCRLLSAPPPSDALIRAARWVMRHENPRVMNQMAASATALRLAGEILEDDGLLQAARRRIARLLEGQHPQGYFVEYGGYDIGYQTITLSCLAKYYWHTRDTAVSAAARAGFRFLDGLIRENGTYDYQATSRKTQYFYPFGFRVMEEWELLNRHRTGLRKNEVVTPAWLDDRYCLPLAIDYLHTAVHDAGVF